MVKKVVKPANNSVRTVVLFSRNLKTRSNKLFCEELMMTQLNNVKTQYYIPIKPPFLLFHSDLTHDCGNPQTNKNRWLCSKITASGSSNADSPYSLHFISHHLPTQRESKRFSNLNIHHLIN